MSRLQLLNGTKLGGLNVRRTYEIMSRFKPYLVFALQQTSINNSECNMPPSIDWLQLSAHFKVGSVLVARPCLF